MSLLCSYFTFCLFILFYMVIYYYNFRHKVKKYIRLSIHRKMKKFIYFIILIFETMTAAAAEKGVNIYAYPRDVPSKVIFNDMGQKVKISDFSGKFLMIVFWSRHCVPCIRELKSLNAFADKTQSDGIKVILVSDKKEWQGGADEQRRFLTKYGAGGLDAYVDNRGDLAAAFGIFSSPVTVLISREGKEIGRIRGSADWDEDEVVEYMYRIKAEHG